MYCITHISIMIVTIKIIKYFDLCTFIEVVTGYYMYIHDTIIQIISM